MGWKKVALIGCAAPALTGCNIWQLAGHNLINEPHVVHTQWTLECEARSHAKAAWKEVRECFPRRMFTADFRDGFEEGFADYLARGGNASPPAVPPPKYTRHKKYYTPEGQCLIRDYLLGFKYGIDVAVATGQRKFFTVPVLLPEKHTGPGTFNLQPGADHPPGEGVDPNSGSLPTPPAASKPQSLTTPTPLPTPPDSAPVPKTVTPAPEAVPPKVVPVVPKTDNLPKLPDNLPKPPDNLPKPPGIPKASAPWNSPATIPATPVSAATPASPRRATVSAPRPPVPRPGYAKANALPEPPKTDHAVQQAGFNVTLPEPPAEVPSLPAHLPTPSIFDDLPVLPANHAVPPPLPANHAVPPPLPATTLPESP